MPVIFLIIFINIKYIIGIICKETIESKVLSSTCPETTTKPSTKRQRPPSASAEGRNKDRDIEKRLQDYEEQHVCTICMERPKTVAFTCGHRTCVVCVETLRSCHMCRVPITQKINLYWDNKNNLYQIQQLFMIKVLVEYIYIYIYSLNEVFVD